MTDTTPQEKAYSDIKIEHKPGSEIEITGEVPVEAAHRHRMKAVKKIVRELELPGFRKGHVPEEMAMKHVGELALMQEAAEYALSEAYAQIVTDEKLDVVGRPNVTITKLAPGNPIGFKITSAVYPTITLPDYRKLAEGERKKHDDPEKEEVTDADIDEELKRLQSMLTPPAGKDGEGKEAEVVAPEIDDAFAQQLGDFTGLADLKEKIKKGMLMEKKQKAQDKRRLAIADAVLTKTNVDVPAVFVEGELDQMVASFEERVQRAGMDMAAYLEQAGKTLEDMRKEWRTDAEKRAKLQLVIGEIAKAEHIEPDAAKLERETAHIMEHYPEADAGAVRAFARSQMVNGMVFALLEGNDPGAVEVSDHDHDHGHDHE